MKKRGSLLGHRLDVVLGTLLPSKLLSDEEQKAKLKEIHTIGRSKIKKFANARNLKEKPKHTLPEKILYLRSYILIESPIEIPQFAFIEFPESRGYRLKVCYSRSERSWATLFQNSKNIIS